MSIMSHILKEGVTYLFGINEIFPNSDSFPKSKTGEKMYCHFINANCLTFGNLIVAGQICAESSSFHQFRAGDTVKMKVTKYNEIKEMYTFQFVSLHNVIAIDTPPAGGVSTPSGQRVASPVGGIGHYNPNVAGTASERALGHAVHLFQMQGRVEIGAVLDAAKKFRSFILEGENDVTTI